MVNRTLVLAIAAGLAVVLGVALSFFELIILGVLAGIVSPILFLRREPAQGATVR
jgi:hypothetical protein